jgi:hypothetical protein
MLAKIKFASYGVDLSILKGEVIPVINDRIDENFDLNYDAEFYMLVDSIQDIFDTIDYSRILIDTKPLFFGWELQYDIDVTVGNGYLD